MEVNFLSSDIIDEISWKNLVFGTKTIEPGTNLREYKGRKVNCEIHFIKGCVANYYHYYDPAQTIYACGYLALDDELQNPFVIFVTPDRQQELDALVEETEAIINGQIPYHMPKGVTVNGYVRKCSEVDLSLYKQAMEKFMPDYHFYDADVYKIQSRKAADSGSFDITIYDAYVTYGIWGVMNIAVVSMLLYNKTDRNLKRFMELHHLTQEQLSIDFKTARKLTSTCYVSQTYTYILFAARLEILRNIDIIWMYKTWMRGSGFSKNYFIYFYTIDKKKHILPDSEQKIDEILSYYKQYFKHITYGKEMKTEYKKGLESFLRLNYYKHKNDYTTLSDRQDTMAEDDALSGKPVE